MSKKGKFDYEMFYDFDNDKRYCCFNKKKYSKLESLILGMYEFDNDDVEYEVIEGKVRFGYYKVDNELYNGYYLENININGIVETNKTNVWVVQEKELENE